MHEVFRRIIALSLVHVLANAMATAPVWADEGAERALFESRIRPVLVEHCYECHSGSSEELQGGLHLDSAAGVLKGGDSGPALVPGQPEESLLLEALRYEGLEMPPSGRLPDHVVRDFERWVSAGAPDPRTDGPAAGGIKPEPSTLDIEAARAFWAFQPVRRYDPPSAGEMDWADTEIDAFVLAQLQEQDMRPAADTDARMLVRRVYFDLIGLPPTPAQVRTFLSAPRAVALERLVDELLDSPQFGVRWGRHWLDVARYADSNGNDFNATFHNAWRYRDYVIQSFNQDKPFDQFVREQVAGDLLPYTSDAQRAEQLIATGFLMVGTKMLSERDKEKMTMDVVDEQINTVGQAFLGLTLGCARCHDHKFDPIPTTDYYALAGIFRSTITLAGESQKYVSTWPRRDLPAEDDHRAAVRAFAARQDQLKAALKAAREQKDVLAKRLASAGDTAQGSQSSRASTTFSQAATGAQRAQKQGELEAIEAEIERLQTELKQLAADAPPPLPKAIAVADSEQIGDCELRIRGEHDNLGPAVPRGFVRVAMTRPSPALPDSESGRRQLADWIASSANPLTARVIVNRIWHHLMGQGLVRTVDNFGQLGERPTHPELLDHLAFDFMRDGWSIKRTIRRIVLSRIYRAGTAYNKRYWQRDPENRFLWRANRKRLSAEAIRDSMLAISGRLDRTAAGSPVEGLGTLVTQNSADQGRFQRQESLHRSAYLPIIRGELPPMLVAFDFADPDLVVGRRSVTSAPTQSLLLLNSPFVMECAEQTALRIQGSEASSDRDLAFCAYEQVLSREPSDAELERAVNLLREMRQRPDSTDGKNTPHPLARLVHTLFASTEFRMLD